MRSTKIYALVNPEENQVFYIGQTSVSLSHRLSGHLRFATRRSSRKDEYVSQLLDRGLRPLIQELVILNDAGDEEIVAAEQAWIDFYQAQGVELLNTYPALRARYGTSAMVWTPEMIALVGVLPDCEVADQLECPISAVSWKRRSLGLPYPYTEPVRQKQVRSTYKRGRKPETTSKLALVFKWSIECEALLGTASDATLAKQFGCRREIVSVRRRDLGIPAYFEEPVSAKPLPYKRKCAPSWLTPEIYSKLGKVSDIEIAKEVGRDRKTVQECRQKLGILPCVPGGVKVAGWNKKHLPNEVIELLGKQPDYKLAAIAGVNKGKIASERKRRGIPSYAESTGRNGQFRQGEPHRRWYEYESGSHQP